MQNLNIKCNTQNSGLKVGKFLKSTKTASPTSNFGATRLSPIGHSFMYKGASQTIHGRANFTVSFERTEFLQINCINFFTTDFQF